MLADVSTRVDRLHVGLELGWSVGFEDMIFKSECSKSHGMNLRAGHSTQAPSATYLINDTHRINDAREKKLGVKAMGKRDETDQLLSTDDSRLATAERRLRIDAVKEQHGETCKLSERACARRVPKLVCIASGICASHLAHATLVICSKGFLLSPLRRK